MANLYRRACLVGAAAVGITLVAVVGYWAVHFKKGPFADLGSGLKTGALPGQAPAGKTASRQVVAGQSAAGSSLLAGVGLTSRHGQASPATALGKVFVGVDMGKALGDLHPLYQAQKAFLALDQLAVVLESGGPGAAGSETSQAASAQLGTGSGASAVGANAPSGKGSESSAGAFGGASGESSGGGPAARVLLDEVGKLDPQTRQAVENLYKDRETLRLILDRFAGSHNSPKLQETLKMLRSLEKSGSLSLQDVFDMGRLVARVQGLVQDQSPEDLALAQEQLSRFVQTHEKALDWLCQPRLHQTPQEPQGWQES